MKIHTSGKDYLEAVLMLQRKVGIVRSVDPARHIFQKLKAKDQKVGGEVI